MDVVAATQSVKFDVFCKHTQMGETVAVCGASPALGEWDPWKSLHLITSPSMFPKWSSAHPINIYQGTEYKFIILQHDNRIWWESHENRRLPSNTPSGSCVQISADFDQATVTAEIALAPTFAASNLGMDTIELCKVFSLIDAKRRGKINRRDLIKAVKESPDVAAFFGLSQSLKQEDASRVALEYVFQAIDQSGSREITWPDFHTFYAGFPPVLPSVACATDCIMDAETALQKLSSVTQMRPQTWPVKLGEEDEEDENENEAEKDVVKPDKKRNVLQRMFPWIE